jgi:hypothetical protein
MLKIFQRLSQNCQYLIKLNSLIIYAPTIHKLNFIAFSDDHKKIQQIPTKKIYENRSTYKIKIFPYSSKKFSTNEFALLKKSIFFLAKLMKHKVPHHVQN